MLKDWLLNNCYENGKPKHQQVFSFIKRNNKQLYQKLLEIKQQFPNVNNLEIIYRFLNDDYSKHFCRICGKEIKNIVVYVYSEPKFVCSKKCFKLYQKSKECKEKIKHTFLNNYGVDHFSKTQEFKRKFISTSLDKYGVENPNQCKQVIDKRLTTNQSKYGGNAPICSEKIHNKIKKTCINRYGADNPLQSDKIREKIKQTCITKYGVENPKQSKEIQEKCKLKIHETQEKIYNSKKLNNSFNTSKPEDIIYQKLTKKFSKVERQYKSEKYPFACDFYIPEEDLYIEFQGFWTHGKEPYDPENSEHLKQIETWNRKSEEVNFKHETKKLYENAIKIWTQKDPEKRKIAKENNLNWIEFFSLDQFEGWFDSLK